MMKCPKCGIDGIGIVKDSRVREDYVYRVRECYNCGCRYKTAERFDGMVLEKNEPRRGIKHRERSDLMLSVWSRMREEQM